MTRPSGTRAATSSPPTKTTSRPPFKFVNVLLKHGLDVHKATAPFTVAGKSYPAGSYVVKAAQAFRPAVLDMFEPQDHPMDFAYPGGPPKRPYDITGWTLATQMGIQFDRVMEGFNGPFTKLPFSPEKPLPAAVASVANAVGYLVSHKINDSFILTNRLLKAGADVYWLTAEQTVNGKGLGTGTLYVPASAAALPILEKAAKELGIPAYAVATKPAGEAVKLKPIRIGLVDVYGGSMPSGWLRFMLEQYEFAFEVVFPQVLDAGNLKSAFDVIVFPSGTYAEGRGGRGGGGRGAAGGPSPDTIPEEFRSMLGAVTSAKSVPALKIFVEQGGTVLALGASASIGEAMGLPVKNHLRREERRGQRGPAPGREVLHSRLRAERKLQQPGPACVRHAGQGLRLLRHQPGLQPRRRPDRPRQQSRLVRQQAVALCRLGRRSGIPRRRRTRHAGLGRQGQARHDRLRSHVPRHSGRHLQAVLQRSLPRLHHHRDLALIFS